MMRRDKSRKMNDKLKSVQNISIIKENNMKISSLTLGLVDTNAYFIENEESVILIDKLVNLIRFLKIKSN